MRIFQHAFLGLAFAMGTNALAAKTVATTEFGFAVQFENSDVGGGAQHYKQLKTYIGNLVAAPGQANTSAKISSLDGDTGTMEIIGVMPRALEGDYLAFDGDGSFPNTSTCSPIAARLNNRKSIYQDGAPVTVGEFTVSAYCYAARSGLVHLHMQLNFD